jgi:hypothetical protein
VLYGIRANLGVQETENEKTIWLCHDDSYAVNKMLTFVVKMESNVKKRGELYFKKKNKSVVKKLRVFVKKKLRVLL